MADFNTVAQQFVDFYYKTFDGDRSQLRALYRDNSMLTFETAAVQGVQNIMDKLGTLPFKKVEHKVATIDAQPIPINGGIIVMVTGGLLTEGESKPLSYTQSFTLFPDSGSYWIQNDIFKLVYPM